MTFTILIFGPLLYISYKYRQQIHQSSHDSKQANAMRWLLVSFISLMGAFFAYMGIGEMVGGDASGVMHLVGLLPVVATLYPLLISPRTVQHSNL